MQKGVERRREFNVEESNARAQCKSPMQESTAKFNAGESIALNAKESMLHKRVNAPANDQTGSSGKSKMPIDFENCNQFQSGKQTDAINKQRQIFVCAMIEAG